MQNAGYLLDGPAEGALVHLSAPALGVTCAEAVEHLSPWRRESRGWRNSEPRNHVVHATRGTLHEKEVTRMNGTLSQRPRGAWVPREARA